MIAFSVLDRLLEDPHSGSLFRCEDCGQAWNSEEELREHRKTHRQRSPSTRPAWRCEECGNAFNSPDELARHRQTHKSAAARKSEFEKYRDTVRENLNWLLNTRRNPDPLPEGMKEVEQSVYAYGLPDFSNLNLSAEHSEADRDRLAAAIARTIRNFEPRIMDVRVTVATQPSQGRGVHFHVFGKLKVKPRPEPVCYDTMLDVTRQEYLVEPLGEGRA